MTTSQTFKRDKLRTRTTAWVVGIGTAGLIFDGYDLVVYGTIVPVLLRDSSQIGEVTPQLAGALGALALLGVMIGAFAAGAVSDLIGRRKVMLTGYAWFSIGMGLTALTTSIAMFGLTRLLTGLGVGAVMGTTGALIAEVAPAKRRNLYTGSTYAGIALGAVSAALVAILVQESFGWRAMFWIGALPLVILLPVAYFRLPESVTWLASRGRLEEARAVSAQTGIPVSVAARSTEGIRARTGFAGLFSRELALPTVLLGLITIASLMLVFTLNTWLPELMRRAGFQVTGSLLFLLVLNGAAIIGAVLGSLLADRYASAKLVVAATFLVGVVSAALLTLNLPVGLLLLLVGTVGVGTGGAQLLVYSFTANYYRTNVRGAGVAWVTGVGRLGAVGGPLVGGFLIATGRPLDTVFYVLAGIALLGMVLTLFIPTPGPLFGAPRHVGRRRQ